MAAGDEGQGAADRSDAGIDATTTGGSADGGPGAPRPGAGTVAPYVLTVNGVERRVDDAFASESLLHVLRDRLGLPGAKNACEQGECGSCSVLVDGQLVCACLELAAAATGCAITTIEGIGGDAAPLLTDVQEAMLTSGGVQCGFCTPGIVVAVHDLLARSPSPSPLEVREALSGNLCRCTGYGRILAAVETVVAVRGAAGGPTP